MKSIQKENWETLTIHAPAGFVVYFLKMQEHLKSAFGNNNIEIDNFQRLNDKGFSCKIREVAHDKSFLDSVKNSLFGQLPNKLPGKTKSFIDIKLGN